MRITKTIDDLSSEIFNILSQYLNASNALPSIHIVNEEGVPPKRVTLDYKPNLGSIILYIE